MIAPTRFGTAYFGVRDPDLYRADLAEIAHQGFEWVLFPFTHDDALWERSTFADLVASARALGLTTAISPWGGSEFGGEGVQTALPVEEWIVRARDTGAEVLHVDEPRLSTTSIPAIVDMWGDDRRVWLTIQPERARELAAPVVRRVAVLGTDAYDGDLAARVRATEEFRVMSGRLDLAWVQAFRIADGEEEQVGAITRAMAGLAPRVGIWAWKGSTGRGELRSANPTRVQDAVAAAIRDTHLTIVA